jgi:hypothetical protein
MIRVLLLTALAAAACKSGGDDTAGSGEGVPGAPDAPRPATHTVPKGTIAGKPFAPTHVLLVETSDGGKLGFYAASEQAAHDRFRCEEPMGSDSAFELTKYHRTADWIVGQTLESDLDAWSATSVDGSTPPKGTARVTLSVKDPKSFKVAGKIEIKGDGWDFTGPFAGEYCPTKAVERAKPEPLAGMEWTMAPVDPAKLPTTPLAAVVAGAPASIAHVTLRQVPYHDGSVRQRLIFYAGKPPDPCAPRPEGGHGRVYSFGKLVKVDKPAFQIDSFSIDLVAPPAAGATLAGNYHHEHGEKKDQIIDADLQVFEPDGYRSWQYSQYYSAAMAIDAVTDTEVKARVYLALPDQGKSMLAGAFTATRCPPQTE